MKGRKRHVYTQEQKDFIAKNHKYHTISSLRDAFQKEFGVSITRKQLRSYLWNHGHDQYIREQVRFAEEEKQFIFDTHKGKSTYEIADLLNKKFGTNYTRTNIRNFMRNYNLTTGYANIKKGIEPHNKLPIGSKSFFESNNTMWVKVRDTGVYNKDWELLHIHNWEKENGKVPEGYSLTFIDGNPRNCEVDNLMLVSHEDLMIMNANGYYKTGDRELRKAGILLAKLSRKQNEIKRE